MIKIILVDDSKTARLSLRFALEKDPDILIVGEASCGDEAMALIRRFDPNLVTMDVYLQEENGLDVTRRIMSESARPILIVTGFNHSEPRLIYRGIEAGALDVCGKLPAPNDPDFERRRTRLVRLVKTLAHVPVIHQGRNAWPIRRRPVPKPAVSPRPVPGDPVLLVGASTGGPPVVCTLLKTLSPQFRAPIVIVQHISRGFGRGFAEWLGQASGRRVALAERTVRLEPGRVYVAPDDHNIVFSSADQLKARLPREDEGICPSIDQLFLSAADTLGGRAVALLMTGMGRDGAAGLEALHRAGALTIAQAPETCAVDSMPRAALALNAAKSVLRPDEIPSFLSEKMRPQG